MNPVDQGSNPETILSTFITRALAAAVLWKSRRAVGLEFQW